MTTNIIDRLVEKFGSQAALAQAAGVTQPSVSGWRKAGHVPAKRQARLMASARASGVDLGPEDLLPPVRPEAALRDAEARLRRLLAGARPHLVADLYERIERRLAVVLDADDWEEGDELPDLRSFGRLLQFLGEHPDLRPPSIFLSRRGYFDASWRAAPDKLASIEFHPDGRVSWLVFAPSPTKQEQTEEASGETRVELVLRRVEDYGVNEWMGRET